jgi:hypothetical protein
MIGSIDQRPLLPEGRGICVKGVNPMISAPDQTRQSRQSRWPVGLIGMLALVAVVERSVARNEIRFTTIAVSAWAQGGAHLSEAARSEVLCFGDSLVKDGVLPQVLEDRHGFSAWNLALPGGTAPAHYFLLRRLLRAGARPATLLVDGESLYSDPLVETRPWSELAGPAELADLALNSRDAAFLARTVLAQRLTTYRARHDIRQNVLLALAGETPAATWVLAQTWRNWNANRGAYVLTDRTEVPGVDLRLAELARAGHLMSGWACQPVNDVYIKRFLDLAGAHGIPVFWLLPPTHPRLQAGREGYGWDAAYMGYLRRLQARYPRLTVIDGRHSGYPPSALSDILHLSRTGAIFYTDSVGAVLRDRLASPGPNAPRWVDLPPFSPPAAAALAASSTVEDVDRSALALSRGDNVRR